MISSLGGSVASPIAAMTSMTIASHKSLTALNGTDPSIAALNRVTISTTNIYVI